MVSFNDNQYSQLRDYLSQLNKLDADPKVTQSVIAQTLQVDSSGVSRFFSGTTPRPKKMMTNFVKKYPTEFARWPEGAKKIHRLLTSEDVRFFLNLPSRGAGRSVKRTVATALPPAVAAPATVLQVVPPPPVQVRVIHLPLPEPVAATSTRTGFVPATIKTFRASRTPAAPIVISYRGHQSYRDGSGMLFDHVRIQDLTKHPTLVSYSPNPKIEKAAKSYFKSALLQRTISLKYGQVCEAKRIPSEIEASYHGGLLVIPGRARAVENEPYRLDHEYRVIRQALNRGQPILAICAGVWRLWNQLMISNVNPDLADKKPAAMDEKFKAWPTTIPAKDHCYSTMIQLDRFGVEPCKDKIVHLNDIVPGSHLQDMVSRVTRKVKVMEVNSVHWAAVNPRYVPDNVRVSAYSRAHPDVHFLTRQGTVSEPAEGTVEAFETIHGAPVIGLQWHPEGCKRDKTSYRPSRRAIISMAKAGDVYYAKRRMLEEFAKRMAR